MLSPSWGPQWPSQQHIHLSTRSLCPLACLLQLAAGLPPDHLSSVLSTSAPRAPDGGGVLSQPVALHWKGAPYNLNAPTQGSLAVTVTKYISYRPLQDSFPQHYRTYQAPAFQWAKMHNTLSLDMPAPYLSVSTPPHSSPHSSLCSATRAGATGAGSVLLLAASTAGWLHVYQPLANGEWAWQRKHSGEQFVHEEWLSHIRLFKIRSPAHSSTYRSMQGKQAGKS